MKTIKKFISNLSISQKFFYSIISISFILILVVGIPTLARLMNSNSPDFPDTWDGSSVATDYNSGTGTEFDPYIITNGAELAFFAQELQSNSYENTYFALGSNIIINDGIFDYNASSGIMYILDDVTYYVNAYTNDYYLTSARTGPVQGTINSFPPLENFKGFFEGRLYTIYGLYMRDSSAFELGLFTNLQGTVKNTQLANIMIYGGTVTGGLASSAYGATIHNVSVDGFVVGTELQNNKTITVIPGQITPFGPQTNLQNLNTLGPGFMDLVISVNSFTNFTPPVNIPILVDLPFIGGQAISSNISGQLQPGPGPSEQVIVEFDLNDNLTTQGVNNGNASFNHALGAGLNLDIPMRAQIDDSNGTIIVGNLLYTLTFNYAATGGLIGHSADTEMNYVINKSEVSGRLTSGGLVGTATEGLTITSSYNNGIIRGTYASGGLVGIIDRNHGKETNISESYNTADTEPIKPNINSGGLVGLMFNNTGAINFTNTFNTANNYTLGNIRYSTVNVVDSYYVADDPIGSGTTNGNFGKKNNDVFQEKEVLIEMGFKEYVDNEHLVENPDYCWVYIDNEYPLLYSDSKVKSAANIFVGTYVFSKYTEEVKTVPINNIAFLVETANLFHPIKEKYYYISESVIPLTIQELESLSIEYDWIEFTGVETINIEGNYIIYAMVIDYNDVTQFLNTDMLLLDVTPPIGTATMDSTSWNNLRTSSLPQITLTAPQTIYVEAQDVLSGIKSIEYFSLEEILTSIDLDEIDSGLWKSYDEIEGIDLEPGSYVVYIKITDNAGNITYINTDFINFSSYSINSFTIGRETAAETEDIYISDKSMITFNSSYSMATSPIVNLYTHNIVSNILLPIGTKITMIDFIFNKVYEYLVPTIDDIYGYELSCDELDLECVKVATYPFTLFKEIGVGTTDKMYIENDYYNDGEINENFTITIDFSESDINQNYEEVIVSIELQNSLDVTVRPTDPTSIKSFNIYHEIDSTGTNAKLFLTTDFQDTVFIKENINYDIYLHSGLNYNSLNTIKVFDTTYENKNSGLSITLFDEMNNVVLKEYYKYTIFKIDNNIYSPGSDNTIYIPLDDMENSEFILTIINSSNNTLAEGNYYFKISNYITEDGLLPTQSGIDILVPVTVLESVPPISSFDFDITMDSSRHIVNKKYNNLEIEFDIFKTGDFTSPNVKVSLYEKDEMTAYNQNYIIVDLNEYITDSLTNYMGNIYYATTALGEHIPFTLTFDTKELSYNGYKLVFDLYDGSTKIATINKYFIVR